MAALYIYIYLELFELTYYIKVKQVYTYMLYI